MCKTKKHNGKKNLIYVITMISDAGSHPILRYNLGLGESFKMYKCHGKLKIVVHNFCGSPFSLSFNSYYMFVLFIILHTLITVLLLLTDLVFLTGFVCWLSSLPCVRCIHYYYVLCSISVVNVADILRLGPCLNSVS